MDILQKNEPISAIKTLRHMSRDAQGHRDRPNGKFSIRNSVVVPEESLLHRALARTNLLLPVLRLRPKSLKFSRTLHSADTVWNYDYDAPESRWRSYI